MACRLLCGCLSLTGRVSMNDTFHRRCKLLRENHWLYYESSTIIYNKPIVSTIVAKKKTGHCLCGFLLSLSTTLPQRPNRPKLRISHSLVNMVTQYINKSNHIIFHCPQVIPNIRLVQNHRPQRIQTSHSLGGLRCHSKPQRNITATTIHNHSPILRRPFCHTS